MSSPATPKASVQSDMELENDHIDGPPIRNQPRAASFLGGLLAKIGVTAPSIPTMPKFPSMPNLNMTRSFSGGTKRRYDDDSDSDAGKAHGEFLSPQSRASNSSADGSVKFRSPVTPLSAKRHRLNNGMAVDSPLKRAPGVPNFNLAWSDSDEEQPDVLASSYEENDMPGPTNTTLQTCIDLESERLDSSRRKSFPSSAAPTPTSSAPSSCLEGRTQSPSPFGSPQPIPRGAADCSDSENHNMVDTSDMKPRHAAVDRVLSSEVGPSDRRVRSNSTSSFYLRNTLSHPDLQETIRCMSVVIQHMVERTLETLDGVDLKRMNISREGTPIPFEGSESSSVDRNPPRVRLLKVFKDPSLSLETPESSFPVPNQLVIQNFIQMIFKRAQLSEDCTIISLAYLDRLIEKTCVALHPSNWRPVLVTCLVMASKIWDDLSVTNQDFSFLCNRWGYSLETMNRWEKAFLQYLKYDVNVSSSLYAKYYFELRAVSLSDNKEFPLKKMDQEAADLLHERCIAAGKFFLEEAEDNESKDDSSLDSGMSERKMNERRRRTLSDPRMDKPGRKPNAMIRY